MNSFGRKFWTETKMVLILFWKYQGGHSDILGFSNFRTSVKYFRHNFVPQASIAHLMLWIGWTLTYYRTKWIAKIFVFETVRQTNTNENCLRSRDTGEDIRGWVEVIFWAFTSINISFHYQRQRSLADNSIPSPNFSVWHWTRHGTIN